MSQETDGLPGDDLVERIAMWRSLDIIAHERRPIDDETAVILRNAALMIKNCVPYGVAFHLADSLDECFPNPESDGGGWLSDTSGPLPPPHPTENEEDAN